MFVLTLWFVCVASSWNFSVAVRDQGSDDEQHHSGYDLPPKDLVNCQVCLKIAQGRSVDCNKFVASALGFSNRINGWVTDEDIEKIKKDKKPKKGRAAKEGDGDFNLMDNIGSVHPSDLAEWTNPRPKDQRIGGTGKVSFRDEEINWMIAQLINRGMADEPNVPRSDYARVLKHLKKAFDDNNDKVTQFCTKVKKFMEKKDNSHSCKAIWRDDSEKLFKDRQKSETLEKSSNVNDYCSCVAHNQNPGQWTKTAFHDRTKCPQ